MSSNHLEEKSSESLSEGKPKSGRADGILASIFQGMRERFNVSDIRFNSLITSYVTRRSDLIKGDATNYKGNLERVVRQDRLTWSNFLRLIAVINVKDFELSVIILDDEKRLTKSTVVVDLRNGPDTDEAEAALAKLYKKILENLQVNATFLWNCLNNYAKLNRPNASSIEVQNFRGHLKKELLKKKISWNVFVKGIVLLEREAFRIEIRLRHFSGNITIHLQDVYLTPDLIDVDLFKDQEHATTSNSPGQ